MRLLLPWMLMLRVLLLLLVLHLVMDLRQTRHSMTSNARRNGLDRRRIWQLRRRDYRRPDPTTTRRATYVDAAVRQRLTGEGDPVAAGRGGRRRRLAAVHCVACAVVRRLELELMLEPKLARVSCC